MRAIFRVMAAAALVTAGPAVAQETNNTAAAAPAAATDANAAANVNDLVIRNLDPKLVPKLAAL